MMPIFRRNAFIIISTIVVMLITVRVLLPSVILKELNTYLATFSAVYRLHLTDVDLSLTRGAYRLEGVEGQLKKNHSMFLNVKEIEVSLAWRKLLKGSIELDIEAKGLHLDVVEGLKENTLESIVADAKAAKTKVFPFPVSRFDVSKSAIGLFTHVQGKITNHKGNVFFKLEAILPDSTLMTSQGKINFRKTPLTWSLDSRLHNHPFFTMEAISHDGDIMGYVKPFKGPPHWFYDVLTAGSKLTKIKLNYDTAAVLK